MGLYTIEKPGQGMRARLVALFLLLLLFGWGSYECHRTLYHVFGLTVELPDPNVDVSAIRFTPFDGSRATYGIAQDGTVVRIGGASDQRSNGIALPYRFVRIVDGQRIVIAQAQAGERPDELQTVATIETEALPDEEVPAGEADDGAPDAPDVTAPENGADEGNGNGNGNGDETDTESDPAPAHDADDEGTEEAEADAEALAESASNGSAQTQPGGTQVGGTDGVDETIGETVARTEPRERTPRRAGPQPFDLEPFLEGDRLVSRTEEGLLIEIFQPEVYSRTEELTAAQLADPANWLSTEAPLPTILDAGEWWDPVVDRQVNGTGVAVSGVIGIVVFLIFFTIFWRLCMGPWKSRFLIETDQELNRVHWPTRDRVVHSAMIVIIVIVVIGVLLFAADALLNATIRALQLW